MEYIVDDKKLDAFTFIAFVKQVWQGNYDIEKQGVGSKLLQLAKDNTPTMLYFGAQPGIEKFYEKNGCKRSLQSYVIEKERS